MTFNVTLKTRFRVFCNDDNYKSKWFDTENEAITEANKHITKNPEHDIRIEKSISESYELH